MQCKRRYVMQVVTRWTQWAWFLAMIGGIAVPLGADVPRSINYQGKLSDSTGACYSGTVSLRLRFYTTDSGGTALFDETQNSVVVSQGLFNVLIGSVAGDV